MTTFIKPDTSRVKVYNNGLAFEQLSMEERLAYFHKAGNIMKLKNNRVVIGDDKFTEDCNYHDDFFVYYPSVVGKMAKGSDRAFLAIPRDIVKYAFYSKVGNKLHEIMKDDHEEDAYGQVKRAVTLALIVCRETGINVPLYYYNLDKNFMYMPFHYESGVVNLLAPATATKSHSAGNLDLDWIRLCTDRKLGIDDIPKFYYHDEMNVPYLMGVVSSPVFHRTMGVMERVLLRKNFVVDANTIEGETIAEVMFEELKV